MDKRYQVFISSTFADLKEERRAVIQTVIELNCIPAGMELFPASDEAQLKFIKRVIDDCDYYVLIIGGRYGTVDKTGLSYTEQEYDYAVSKKLKVVAFVHENPGEIPFAKSEADPELRERLAKFKTKVCDGRLVKLWKSAHELPGLVALSLSSTIHQFPAIGWVRANKAANEEILGEINNLRKHNANLQEKLRALDSTPEIENLAALDEELRVFGEYWIGQTRIWEVTTTWRKLFALIAPFLIAVPTDAVVQTQLCSDFFKLSGRGGGSASLDTQLFKTIGIQLKALKLININYSEATNGTMYLFWSLTTSGERMMVQMRTIRSSSTEVPRASEK